MIISDPEIRCFKIEPSFDFIMIGCDGIFDKLNNRDVVNTIWDSTLELLKSNTGKKNNNSNFL